MSLEGGRGLDQLLPPWGGNIPRSTFAFFSLGPGLGQVPVSTALAAATPGGTGRAAPVPPSGEPGHDQGHRHLPAGNPRPESPRGSPSSTAQGEIRCDHGAGQGALVAPVGLVLQREEVLKDYERGEGDLSLVLAILQGQD